jgi:hypothetical protein
MAISLFSPMKKQAISKNISRSSASSASILIEVSALSQWEVSVEVCPIGLPNKIGHFFHKEVPQTLSKIEAVPRRLLKIYLQKIQILRSG